MARTGISSYITKSSSYPTSGYSSSHCSNYAGKSYSSYKPTHDFSRLHTTTTPLRTHDSSRSGYLQSSSKYSSYLPTSYSSVTTPSLESKRYGLTVDRTSRRDSYGSKPSFSSSISRYSRSPSTSYQSPVKEYNRTYGRFSQERTIDVSRDLRELSLGPRAASLRRSNSQFDLAGSRGSMERASVGRDEEANNDEYRRHVTPRVHPTMGIYATDRSVEKRLGGNSDIEIDENGKVDSDCVQSRSSYGGLRSGRRSPSADRWNANTEGNTGTIKRYSSADSNTRISTTSKLGDAHRCSGLRNIGNTCFMNSVLQCLAHTQPLLEYCLESQYEADINRDASRMKGVLISGYAELMNSMWNGQETVVSPTKFKCEVARFAKLFLGYNQQDAQEFLLYLLQGLHEDVNRVHEKKKRHFDDSNEVETISASEKARKSWKEHLEFENSKIVDLFEGQLKSALTCTECGYVSNTFDPALGLSLPIKKSHGASVSLMDCLELFTQEEVLDGHERTMCARCKRKQKATKRLSIQKFPQILVINLKRFNDENAYRSKLSTEVKCPLRNLDLKMFSAEKFAGSIVYDLYAVSNHSGTPSGGHYTAAARNPYTREWQYFNDHRVTPMSESDVVTSEAYILFYELSSGSLAL